VSVIVLFLPVNDVFLRRSQATEIEKQVE